MKKYNVLENYDPEKDYGIKIQGRLEKCLKLLNKGETVSQSETNQRFQKQLGKDGEFNEDTVRWLISRGFSVGEKIGLLEQLDKPPISFKEFCELETVEYFAKQLRGSKFKNLKKPANKIQSTKMQYLYQLWKFSNWLYGKEFVFTRIRLIDENTFRKQKQKVILENVEQLLKLYQESDKADSEYIKVIKRFLMDDIHGNVSSTYMKGKQIAICSYFEKNDSPLRFRFDPSVLYNNEENENDEIVKLSLEDLLNMFTSGRTSLLDKAVVMCKFHRGLDNSTFVDRFNFQAWEQLVKWFGTEVFEKWDLEKCPVPITLIRIKTGYKHRGFLDIDAIEVLQKYLKYRYEQTGKTMSVGEPIFLNPKNQPISEDWVEKLIPRLAKNAGIQRKFMVNNRIRNEKTSHELRDLLKSTLIVSGVVQYVCDLAIGHRVGDSYEKQDHLYPEKSRAEYMKASKKLNFLSNVTHYMNGDDERQILLQQINDMKETHLHDKRGYELELQQIKSVLNRLVENEGIKNKVIPSSERL